MKKNTIKAFTLVEMLIVIVIIGILIASLMPRMQTAQGRARDVARKNDLSQIQTAIITSQTDRKSWPGMELSPNTAKDGIPVKLIKDELTDAGMSSVPTDPNGSNINFGLGDKYDINNKVPGSDDNVGEYLYIVAKRNGVNNAGFALMAKTEVEGSSNWVTCDSNGKSAGDGRNAFDDGYIMNDYDLSKITLCKTVSESKANPKVCKANQDDCTYATTSQLRYLLVY